MLTTTLIIASALLAGAKQPAIADDLRALPLAARCSMVEALFRSDVYDELSGYFDRGCASDCRAVGRFLIEPSISMKPIADEPLDIRPFFSPTERCDSEKFILLQDHRRHFHGRPDHLVQLTVWPESKTVARFGVAVVTHPDSERPQGMLLCGTVDGRLVRKAGRWRALRSEPSPSPWK